MPEVRSCGLCHSAGLRPLLDMGEQPLAERDNGSRYPLKLMRCQSCGLVQLSHAVSQRQVFTPEHPYTTGTSAALRRHFAALAERVGSQLSPGDLVVDIGANDGTLLSSFSPQLRRVAVEPTGQAAKCAGKGLAAYQAFFSPQIASTVVAAHGHAQAVTATNVLAHVPDAHAFVSGVSRLLEPGALFVCECHDFAQVERGLQIDTVYHEHLRYFTPSTLLRLLSGHGLEAESVEKIPTHGGSFRVWARKGRGAPSSFEARAKKAASDLHKMMDALTWGGRRPAFGVGAATRAVPIMHFARIEQYISHVCEHPDSEKIGTMMPGTSIPVVPDSELVRAQPPYALVFSWHIASDIVPKLRQAGYKGRFLLPLPEPKVMTDEQEPS